jgi:hypothetical protein
MTGQCSTPSAQLIVEWYTLHHVRLHPLASTGKLKK